MLLCFPLPPPTLSLSHVINLLIKILRQLEEKTCLQAASLPGLNLPETETPTPMLDTAVARMLVGRVEGCRVEIRWEEAPAENEALVSVTVGTLMMFVICRCDTVEE